ncbi:hypothetical protein JG688_00005827 [Phytophthora aleatoria]|uniref:PH domain-containing protein n=1 Tax=Phytophthora aleatoria TaxID=2496075 RepID=A0A8J5IZA2_9STRA|nr:hypothetical protein JG688_00005827 [Phytophthora aleatoria]
MAFPTLSRRHVATPINRYKRRSHRHNSNCNSTTPKVSSPQKCARSESLRSTWMTNGSDSMEDDQDLNQETDAESEALQVFVQLQRPLSDWVYWQRDAVALPDCWTKVFAVFYGNILWLYRYEDASAKSLLVRIRTTALDDGNDGRQLLFRDAATATSVQLYMPDAPSFLRWHSHVSTALAKFPPVEEEEESVRQSAAMVPAVASAMKKRRFWKALSTAVVAGTKTSSNCQVSAHEEIAMVVYDGQSRKSLRQRWKDVTTTLKSALKRDKRHPQLQLGGGRGTVG